MSFFIKRRITPINTGKIIKNKSDVKNVLSIQNKFASSFYTVCNKKSITIAIFKLGMYNILAVLYKFFRRHQMQKITVTKTTSPKQKPDMSNLGFGKVFSDHMFIMDYSVENGWYDPRIVPYGPLSLDPSTMALHYGQSVFEGMKAYRSSDDHTLLFRPGKNMARLNSSNERICIPNFDEDLALEGIKQLILLDKDWIPSESGSSLYVRPFVFATDPVLGVHASSTYLFIVILSPSGRYYPCGLAPVKIYVENEYVRSVVGGTGCVKTAGNYAASLKAQMIAEEKGYTQVLWLDGVEHKYIEEVGAMNVFFKISGVVITPMLTGSILPGITRLSIIELLNHMNITVQERKISVREVFDAYESGTLEEAFGTGTAAVISPIGELCWDDKKIQISDNKIGDLSQKLYDTLTGIQYGEIDDPFGWRVTID
jgi:branched-chain amino acid aminotransferase